MITYLIKRILLMIPTFFLISLVVFGIISIAPGLPGGVGSGGGFGTSNTEQSATQSVAAREGYAIFKQQFNLDKPIIFNTLPNLKVEKIRDWLNKNISKGMGYTQKELLVAEDSLEDSGTYSVPHLISIATDKTEPHPIRMAAMSWLAQNARMRPKDVYMKNISDENRRYNREVDRQNQVIRATMTPEGTESPEEIEELSDLWRIWFEERREQWNYGFFDKLKIFFFDTRFSNYWAKLFKMDFGVSLVYKEPVLHHIVSKLKYSISLSVTSVLIAYAISIPIGIYSSVFQNSRSDRIITVILFMLYSLPSFFVATLLLYFFSQGSEYFRIFPTGGFQSINYMEMTTLTQIGDIIWHLILPVICLTYGSFASLSRYARSGLLEVIRSDYIRTARAKGLSESVVIFKHAVRNGMIPIITLLGTLLPAVIGGSVVIEFIFGIPGMGKLSVDAIFNRDYNIIMGIQLISAFLVLVGIMISDLCYAIVDPRISFK